jgi:hypothetical protein
MSKEFLMNNNQPPIFYDPNINPPIGSQTSINMVCLSVQGETDKAAAEKYYGEGVACNATALFIGASPGVGVGESYQLVLPMTDWVFAETVSKGSTITITVQQVFPILSGLRGEVQP